MSSSLARALRRRRRAALRRMRRAVRRRARRATRRLRTRVHAWQAKRARHRSEIRTAHAAAGPLAPRSITGTPRPARTPASPAPRPAPVARKAAPMRQRVKRDKDGKFNGSTGTAKKAASKKTAAQKTTAQQRQAAQFQRALSAGNNRVARVDKRTDAADARLNREFGHGHD